MSRSVSLPIIGLGAAAVKSASDLETLETSFISLAGGANEAAQLVNQLNEFTAKTPFQLEAVGNAARQLIAAGTGVDEVNTQLQFLGDIAATSGSSIDEIAAIFSKVQAKGKVELESLNQLAERGIPIFTALSEATGLPASELGAGAVSLDQFNETLASFAEEGGFAAGAMERLSQTAAGKFSTALDNLKLAGAELGAELLPLIKDLLDQVVEVAQSFSRLDSGTKKLIIRLAAFAAAMGPVSKGIGGVLNGVADLRTGFKGLAKQAPKLVGLLTNPWVLVGAAVLAAGVAIYDYNKSVDQTAIVQGRLQNAQDEARKGYVQEQAEVSALLKQYKFYEGDLDQRKAILEKLNGISPTYFGNLDAEKTAYADLATEAQKYTDAIKEQAIQKAFGEELIEVEARRLTLAEELREKEVALADAEALLGRAMRSTSVSVKDGGDQRITLGQTVNSLKHDITNLQDELEAEGTAFEKLQAKIARANEKTEEAAKGKTELAAETTKAIPTLADLRDRAIELEGAIADAQEKAQAGLIEPQVIEDLQKELKDVVDTIELIGGSLESLPRPEAMDLMSSVSIDQAGLDTGIEQPQGLILDAGMGSVDLSGIIAARLELERLGSELYQFAGAADEVLEGGIETGIVQIASAIGSAAGGATEPLKNLGKTLLGTFASLAIELGTLAIGYGIAIESIKKALKSLKGPLAIAAGVVLVGLGAGLQAAVSKSGKDAGVPAFAQGGLVTGPTLAMVGDNASGKEAIIPFERMGEFMKMAGGGQSQQVVVTGRISGKDIVLSNERAGRDRSRIK